MRPFPISSAATLMGLALAGIGFGIVMPSVIEAVIGRVDPPQAGLASGIIISTLQIGAALGVAIVGGILYGTPRRRDTSAAYARAFATALGCNVALLLIAGLLSLLLPRPRTD